MNKSQAMLSGAYFVFGGCAWPRPKASRPADDPFCQKQHSKPISGDVHGPDGPVFGGAKCPRAEDHHEIDQRFSAAITPAVQFWLSGFSSARFRHAWAVESRKS